MDKIFLLCSVSSFSQKIRILLSFALLFSKSWRKFLETVSSSALDCRHLSSVSSALLYTMFPSLSLYIWHLSPDLRRLACFLDVLFTRHLFVFIFQSGGHFVELAGRAFGITLRALRAYRRHSLQQGFQIFFRKLLHCPISYAGILGASPPVLLSACR